MVDTEQETNALDAIENIIDKTKDYDKGYNYKIN